ncbi:hypothetical protein M758_8G037400 [Ceratodon purpureus]|nr:hypothetical protein M758_8G037400 [Ceratodon purpureus]
MKICGHFKKMQLLLLELQAIHKLKVLEANLIHNKWDLAHFSINYCTLHLSIVPSSHDSSSLCTSSEEQVNLTLGDRVHCELWTFFTCSVTYFKKF